MPYVRYVMLELLLLITGFQEFGKRRSDCPATRPPNYMLAA